MSPDMLLQLSITLLLMFFGALGAGCLPYFVNLQSQLDTVGALGGGLLVGTALAVIVPEGFHMFAEVAEAHGHNSQKHGHTDHDHVHEGPAEGLAGLVLVAGFLAMLLIDHAQHAAGGDHAHHQHSHRHSHRLSGGSSGKDHPSGLPENEGDESLAALLAPPAGAAEGLAKQDKCAAASPAAAGGASGLIKVAGSCNAGREGPDRAVLGLIIHCIADGLAMGVAALSGNARLSALIGAAMVLHKAPMAFGLAAYLMACKWPWQRAQRVLVVFSLTAPAATLATYLLLGSLPIFTSPTAVALALLFSGGTFLYAATMHILPEVMGSAGHTSSTQLAAVVAGGLLPILLSWGHMH